LREEEGEECKKFPGYPLLWTWQSLDCSTQPQPMHCFLASISVVSLSNKSSLLLPSFCQTWLLHLLLSVACVRFVLKEITLSCCITTIPLTMLTVSNNYLTAQLVKSCLICLTSINSTSTLLVLSSGLSYYSQSQLSQSVSVIMVGLSYHGQSHLCWPLCCTRSVDVHERGKPWVLDPKNPRQQESNHTDSQYCQ
jgi:hypothetical protein